MHQFVTLLPMVFLLLLAGCNNPESTTEAQQAEASADDQLFFASLNRAIHQGQYDGTITLGNLKKHGTLGVGSSARLAYELVLVDGIAYGIPADGKVYELPDTTQIPFAAIKHFRPEQKLVLNRSVTLQELEVYLDSVLTRNTFAALKVSGRFSKLKYRSFNPQQPPYKSTEQVPDVLFERENLTIDMVGFFTPESAEVLNSPVYHFHFVDEGRTTGGHVLNGVAEQVTIEIDYASGLQVQLPDPKLLQHLDLNKPINE
ncbi:acetolactate decarboxylase [Pontibacter qinzhouensis]|uniref:Alpha-acetolactate decarboxylase n=1 Tax=Pontibacter qinzhouensis TaxID=2603253 RepID=A0A5C8JKQ4_9BACT|nr:acetolactate decarboxylase [Pontibacter qinzhouensis]TXK37264.1 acetolactate decarboxylase [Pontibacter qinzhouensis]